MGTEAEMKSELITKVGPVNLNSIDQWTEMLIAYTVGSALTLGALQDDNPPMRIANFKNSVKKIIRDTLTQLMEEDGGVCYYLFTETAINVITDRYNQYVTFRMSGVLEKGKSKILRPGNIQ